jgi:hypothetical protein
MSCSHCVISLTIQIAAALLFILTLHNTHSEPEIQYVALRNINLIVQKRPKVHYM